MCLQYCFVGCTEQFENCMFQEAGGVKDQLFPTKYFHILTKILFIYSMSSLPRLITVLRPHHYVVIIVADTFKFLNCHSFFHCYPLVKLRFGTKLQVWSTQ